MADITAQGCPLPFPLLGDWWYNKVRLVGLGQPKRVARRERFPNQTSRQPILIWLGDGFMASKAQYSNLVAQGLCPQCKLPVEPPFVHCEACRDRARMYYRKKTQESKVSGRCYYCGGQTDTIAAISCSACKSHQREVANTANHARMAAGKCMHCQSPAKEGYKVCSIHLVANRNSARKRHQERKANRLCTMCGEQPPRDGHFTCSECCERRGITIRTRYLRVKRRVYQAYGGPICACCGEADERFLTLDHINNDGAAHRKEVNPGMQLYRWLEDQGFPPEYQILCFNCNHGRYLNGGICPHKDGGD